MGNAHPTWLSYQFQQKTNDELIDFALEHLGQKHEAICKAALQEHFFRVKDPPNTGIAPVGDIEILKLQRFAAAKPVRK